MDNYFQKILNEYTESKSKDQIDAIRKKEGISFRTSAGHPTQRANTTATYLKFFKLLTPEEQKGIGLDYSAGLGKGSAILRQEFNANIESYEPFPHENSEDITYSGINSLPDKLYDYIFCSAVLNVVEQDIRDFIVQDIFAHLKPGGEAIIGVRSKADVLSARTAYVIDAENGEIIDRVRGSYQKGFTGPELREYISTILPEASVTRVEVSGFSQIVVRVARSEWDAYEDLTEAIGTLKYSARRDREGGLMVAAYDTTKQDINGNPLCIAHLHVPADRIRWNRFSVGDVNVAKEYRRQGIATKMYELAEKKLKTKATPSEIQSPDAKEFWKKRELTEGIDNIDTQLKKLGLLRSRKYGIGKEIGGNIYVYKTYDYVLPQEELYNAKSFLPEGFQYTVVKYNPTTKVFSFILSEDFNTNPEPSIDGGITITSDGKVNSFPAAGWIYHHKWMWVADDYTGFDVEQSKLRSLEWASLPNIDRTRIGQKKYWDANVVPLLKDNTIYN